MSISNLRKFFGRADPTDLAEGVKVYERYHELMRGFADMYGFSLSGVIAAFVSLSPNSDYYGNLRSLASVLQGLRDGVPHDQITVSTYNHCKHRAIAYLLGHAEFLTNTTGPKIKSFYHNVLNPWDQRWVTIDGHMVNIWLDTNKPMKESLISKRTYVEIADAVKHLAFQQFMIPCQYQAVCWFARKRLFNVVYSAQLSLLHSKDDQWRTMHDPRAIIPYTRNRAGFKFDPARHVEPEQLDLPGT